MENILGALQAIGVAFGGAGVLLLVVGWLGQTFINNRLNRSLEEFKNDLKKSEVEHSERLKAALQIVNVEHGIRFKGLFEKRAEVISDVHRRITEVFLESQRATQVIRLNNSTDPLESLYRADESAVDLYNYYTRHRPYLPVAICEQIDSLLAEVRKNLSDFGYAISTQDRHGTVTSDYREMWISAHAYFNEYARIPLRALEAEFRAILDPADASTKPSTSGR